MLSSPRLSIPGWSGFLVLAALLAAACLTDPANRGYVSGGGALDLVHEFAEEDPALAFVFEQDPFYVGSPAGYVSACHEENLLCSVNPAEIGHANVVFVVFRRPFLPGGGGSEDIFIVDPKTDRVFYRSGLKGR